MAGDWLKMEASTPEKEEVLAITARMGWDDPDLTVGKLFRLWRWFDQQTVNGNAARVTSALLDRVVGVSGFCEALREVRWLEINSAGVTLPKFDRHNGKTAKARALTAKRVANHKQNGIANANGHSVTEALPREEKRREEKKTLRAKARVDEGRFPEFWALWPGTDRKTDRKKCEAKWRQAGFDEHATEILAHIAAMKMSRKWTDGFEPAPLRYLNGEQWRDGVAVQGRTADVFAGAI